MSIIIGTRKAGQSIPLVGGHSVVILDADMPVRIAVVPTEDVGKLLDNEF